MSIVKSVYHTSIHLYICMQYAVYTVVCSIYCNIQYAFIQCILFTVYSILLYSMYYRIECTVYTVVYRILLYTLDIHSIVYHIYCSIQDIVMPPRLYIVYSVPYILQYIVYCYTAYTIYSGILYIFMQHRLYKIHRI